MSTRRYYGVRTGRRPDALQVDLPLLRRMFFHLYEQFRQRGYFWQAFGKSLQHDGTLAPHVEAEVAIKLRNASLFPVDRGREYSEEDIFDLVEFLYDHISKPFESVSGDMHGFSKPKGREEFRAKINEVLRGYGSGWELQANGEIGALPPEGLKDLLDGELPTVDEGNVNARIRSAVKKFRSPRASTEERREAVRSLADVLEYLRPQVQAILTDKDESDLFELANRFGIRHHRRDQKVDYDLDVWLPWMFYYYYATIQALLQLLDKTAKDSTKGDGGVE